MTLLRDGERLFSAHGLVHTSGLAEPLRTPLSTRLLKWPLGQQRRFLATCLRRRRREPFVECNEGSMKLQRPQWHALIAVLSVAAVNKPQM